MRDFTDRVPPSPTHLVLIPTYNTGPVLHRTVADALAVWQPVWVVVDGSTDGSDAGLEDCGVRVVRMRANGGKGAALHYALRRAERLGFTHVLTLDADGQHPAALIPQFMAASMAAPRRMILGQPRFGRDAPLLRVLWRRVSNLLANIETAWAGIGDSLFGFRVYPIRPLLEVMAQTRWMRGFDFEAEAAVRLCWRGTKPVTLPAPVRYFSRTQGGVSHFRYGRDNLLLAWMHLRLFARLLAGR